jgi:hypothetical protein
MSGAEANPSVFSLTVDFVLPPDDGKSAPDRSNYACPAVPDQPGYRIHQQSSGNCPVAAYAAQ